MLIKIRQYFPPNDDLATEMARMCILFEDFLLESEGYKASTISDLDHNSLEFRQIYFLRNLFKTACELNKAFYGIRSNQEFKVFLQKQEVQKVKKYEDLYKKYEQYVKPWGAIRGIRNEIGAHLKKETVKDALGRMIDEEEELFPPDGSGGMRHFKFTWPIVGKALVALIAGKTQNDTREFLNEEFRKLSLAVHAARDLCICYFKIYCEGRRLPPFDFL